ncbi:MAG: aldolase/citrate lyase family protein, partial [Mariprofundaceae bacterium]|nr:aldolase/citrate lyase family protein [Mariprofundaceae bacterium]
VGLYRTEFLLAGVDRVPGEEDQFQHYTSVLHGMEGLPVVFRLMDIGGEKSILFEHIIGNDAHGMNPALGLRGIRILLRHPDILRVQLRALLRSADEGDIQILIPMVTHPDEIIQVRDMLNECARELGVKSRIPVGAMIEVPAAVMIADELTQVSDFFSIGTNDLIQYTLAADRTDDEVAYLYDASHPAVESMLRLTVRAAKKAGIPITMCGEMAADRKWTERLMNMGFDALSMSLNHILPVRKRLSGLYYHPEEN